MAQSSRPRNPRSTVEQRGRRQDGLEVCSATKLDTARSNGVFERSILSSLNLVKQRFPGADRDFATATRLAATSAT
jgi:hypothetical protein